MVWGLLNGDRQSSWCAPKLGSLQGGVTLDESAVIGPQQPRPGSEVDKELIQLGVQRVGLWDLSVRLLDVLDVGAPTIEIESESVYFSWRVRRLWSAQALVRSRRSGWRR
jgi:hypothetical protein